MESPINMAIPLESVSTPNSSQLMAWRPAQRNGQGGALWDNGEDFFFSYFAPVIEILPSEEWLWEKALLSSALI